ncbi:MAG TPA: hypothetical protein VFW38_11450 [Solirubrobacteraceae bacterium]|nr:hypothetical protein [Solirubrobacteraceae bacterium]
MIVVGLKWVSGGRARWSRRPVIAGCLPLLATCVAIGANSNVAVARLSEGRAYEQVSPEFKAGYPVVTGIGIAGLSLNGEAAAFSSVGAFSGSGEDFALNPYVARRTVTGWETTALFPSPSGGHCWRGLEEMSSDLSKFELQQTPGGSSILCESSPSEAVWTEGLDGAMVPASPTMTTEGGVESATVVQAASANLNRFVLLRRGDGPPSHFEPGDETITGDQLFETEGPSVVRRVAVDNAGVQLTRYCSVLLGGNRGAFDALSQPDGSEVLFTVNVGTRTSVSGTCEEGPEHPVQLFARLGGSKTVEVSRSPSEGSCTEVPCPGAAARAPAFFQGASEDGSKVFFSTTAKLLLEDEDSGSDLYMATIGCPGGPSESCASSSREVTSLTLVSHDPNPGQAAEVESEVLSVSPDGSHVYFVARGALTQGPNQESKSPVPGAENLYVYENDGAASGLSFVADLCSGPGLSGSVVDQGCPDSLDEASGGSNDRKLWSGEEGHEAQTTPDGRFLVFSTYARLIADGPEGDTDSAKDVYLYDTESGRLRRLSIAESGFAGNDDGPFEATIARVNFRGALQEQDRLGNRAITDDGKEVLFASAEPLSAGAVNAQKNIYIWADGAVHMVSSGTATEADLEPVISPTGRDALFLSSAGLVPGDTDGLRDVYDARVGGGFPPASAPRSPCSGDACQGPLSAPAAMLNSAGTAGQAPGENAAVSPPAKKAKAIVRKTKKKKKKRKAKKSARKRARERARSASRIWEGRR